MITDDSLVFLKPNFVAEPLINKWYAWSHLISPATCCMNIKNRLILIMQDYIRNPEAHAQACRDPRMTGGPFVDLKGGQVDDIKRLLSQTINKNPHLLAFANALEKLEVLLKSEAKGYCLDPLYEKIPAALRGYVELVYDVNNNPTYRIKESLLYKSKYYDESLQSLLCYMIYDDSRPYVLSTPRLENKASLHLQIPFKSEGIDQLYKMTSVPEKFGYIRDILNIKEPDIELFKTFFTEEKKPSFNKYNGAGARVRYFGHACILIETKEISILIDPVISYGYDVEISRYTYADLPDSIDYVLITHNHQDHVLLETMLYLRHKVKNWVVPRNGASSLIDPSLKLMMKNTGFKNVIVLEELDELDIPGGSITALPFFGEHGDLDVASKLGYYIQCSGLKMLCLADSQNSEFKLYEHIHTLLGDIDILFLGMECNGAPVSWMYGPYFPTILDREKDVTRRIAGAGYEAAINIVNRFNVKEAYVYAMGMEPWIKFLSANIYTPECEAIVQSNKLLKECKQNGVIAERLYGEKEFLYV